MRRNVLLLVVTVMGLACAGCDRADAPPSADAPVATERAEPEPTPERPDVVLVTIDTLRADHLGSYGYERATSPALDRLAAEGVRFAQAVSVSSWTLPAHASLLTGLYPHEHGVETAVTRLPDSAVTLPALLAEHGYQTAAFVSHVYLGDRWGFDNGFDHFNKHAVQGAPHRPVARRVVDAALAWLEGRREEDRPFFLWVHVFDPHWDYSPPPPFDTMFDPDYEGTMRGDYESMKPYIRAIAGETEPPPLSERDLEHLRALYDGEIAYTDRHLGRLFDSLKRDKRWDDALVVVVSDHGEEFMEHGSLEGHQWTLYDEVVMVPLLLKLPGAAHAGEVVETQVSTIGVAGTILDYLGTNPGWPTLMQHVDPSRASAEPPRDAFLDLTVAQTSRTVGVRREQFKLLREDDGTVRLYEDPARSGELENLAPSLPEIAGDLSASLDRHLASLDRLADAGARFEPGIVARRRLQALGYAE